MTELLAKLSDERNAQVREWASRIFSLRSGRHAFSGFLWKDGLVVTADEALPHDKDVQISLGGEKAFDAEVVGRDAATDIALLRIPTGETECLSAWASDTPVGASVLVAGASPDGPVAVSGIVSRSGPAWRSMRGGQIDARLELDVFMPPMAEGGIAIAPDNKALGMAVFGPNRRVLVIPGATIDRVAARLETDGRIPRGYVGLGIRPIKLDDGGRGLLVANVDTDGPGAKAGLHQGDILTSFDGEAARSARQVALRLDPDSVGTKIAVMVRRGGEDQEMTIEVSERPTN